MANPQLEEMQELLSEYENRISFLENSLPGSAMSYHPEDEPDKPTPEQPWSKRQWYTVNQLRGEIANLKRKFLDLEQLVTSKGSKYGYY